MTLLTARGTARALVDLTPATRSAAGGPRAASGRAAAAAGVALVLAGTLVPNPVLILLGLATSCTALLLRWLPLDLAVPAAALSMTTAAITAGMVAAALDVDLLARPWFLVVLYLTLSACVLLATLTLAGRRHPSCLHRRGWLALAPVAVAASTGVLQAFSVDVAKSWSFWGTDLARHMTYLSEIQRAGALDYTGVGYPRGLHMLTAFVSVPGAPVQDPTALLGYDLRLVAAVTWLSVALLLWTGAVLTIRLGRSLGLTGRVAACAALLFGSVALLTDTFIHVFVYMGSAPSLLAVVVMWSLALAATDRPAWTDRLPVVAVASTFAAMLLAHLWQALIIVPVVALVTYAIPRLGRVAADARCSDSWRRLLANTPWAVVALALAVPPLAGIQSAGGTALARTLAEVPPGPWRLLVPALVCLALLVRHLHHTGVRLFLGSTVGLLAATAVLLHSAGSGFDLTQYYPTKALWFLTIFLGPLLALGATAGVLAAARTTWRLLGRTGSAARVLRTTALAVTVAVVGALWLPTVLGSGAATMAAWQRAEADSAAGQVERKTNWSGHRYDLARRYGPAYPRDVVVPYFVGYSTVFDQPGTRLVSELLTFQTGQPEVTGDGVDICEKVASVAGTSSAVVISKLSPDQVRLDMANNGCPGRAPVVHVPGHIEVIDVQRAHP